jgi:hypothetical protein
VERWLFLRSGIGRVGILVVADGLGNQNFQVPSHRFPGCVPIIGVRSSFCHPQTVPGELATLNLPRDLGSPQLCICSMLGRTLPASNSTNLSSRNYRWTPIRQDYTAFRSRACCQLECNLWSIPPSLAASLSQEREKMSCGRDQEKTAERCHLE